MAAEEVVGRWEIGVTLTLPSPVKGEGECAAMEGSPSPLPSPIEGEGVLVVEGEGFYCGLGGGYALGCFMRSGVKRG